MDATALAFHFVTILGCRHDDASARKEARPASLDRIAVEGAESGLMSPVGVAHSPSRCQGDAWLRVECTSDQESQVTALIGRLVPEVEECYVRTEEARQPGRQESSGAIGGRR